MNASAAWIGAMVVASFLCAFCTARLALVLVREDMDEGRLGALDGSRGFLGLSVLCTHFWLNLNYAVSGKWEKAPFYALGNLGANAVIAFFMITGFLFYRKVVLSSKPTDWADLYTSRFFRITPVYWVTVTAMFVIALYHTGFVLQKGPGDLIFSAACWYSFTLVWSRYVNGYADTNLIVAGVVWTLRYEWIFYFLLPLLSLAARRFADARQRILFVIVPLMAASVILSKFGVDGIMFKFGLCFAFGMLGAEMRDIAWLRQPLQGLAGTIVVAVGLLLSVGLHSDGDSIVRFLAIALVFLPIAVGNTLHGLLLSRSWRLLGDASYSTYLLHGPVLHIAFQVVKMPLDLNAWTAWFALPVLAVLVSALSIASYFCIERPFIALGRHVRPRRGRISATEEIAP